MAEKGKRSVEPIARRVMELMADGQERTVTDVAQALGLRANSVAHVMRDLAREGGTDGIHIARIASREKVYARGRRDSLLSVMADRIDRRGVPLREDWPAADPVTQQAMHAMVCVGESPTSFQPGRLRR